MRGSDRDPPLGRALAWLGLAAGACACGLGVGWQGALVAAAGAGRGGGRAGGPRGGRFRGGRAGAARAGTRAVGSARVAAGASRFDTAPWWSPAVALASLVAALGLCAARVRKAAAIERLARW